MPAAMCSRAMSDHEEHEDDLFDLYKSKTSGANDDANIQSGVLMLKSIVYHFTSVSHDITQRYDGFDCRLSYQTHPFGWSLVNRPAFSLA